MQEELRKVYDTLSDEELIQLIQDRDDRQAQEYLLDKYKEFIRIRASRYFLVGAEKEDIIQEGMIGLFKAIRDYRPGKQASFKVFAEVCVNRQIISAIKSATRQKHRPLNCYVSLDKPVFEEGKERTLLDMLGGSHGVDPENLLVDQEAFNDIERNVSAMLSSLEWQALCKYLESKSYQEIARELQRSTKSIDNALQRVKRKLEKYLASRNHELDLMAEAKGWDYVDTRLLITEEFLKLLPSERKEKAPEMLTEELSGHRGDVILLDRVQTLFVPVFHIDPKSVIDALGKAYTVVLAWPGYVNDGLLCYDKFDGTESIRISAADYTVWEVE